MLLVNITPSRPGLSQSEWTKFVEKGKCMNQVHKKVKRMNQGYIILHIWGKVDPWCGRF